MCDPRFESQSPRALPPPHAWFSTDITAGGGVGAAATPAGVDMAGAGYGGWGAYGGLPYFSGLGGYSPMLGTYYGGYANYGYPLGGFGYWNYGLPAYGYATYGYPSYGYAMYGYPAYGGYSCGCGYGGDFYGPGYRIW